jgi:hypothetical protein
VAEAVVAGVATEAVIVVSVLTVMLDVKTMMMTSRSKEVMYD